MSNPSPQPSETKQSEKTDWNARAATLKQQLMQRRLQTASSQPESMSFTQDASGQIQQQEQSMPSRSEPVQTTTTSTAQGQTIPGLSYQLPDEMGLGEETSRSKKPPKVTATDESGTKDSIQKSQAMTKKLMAKLTPPVTARTIGRDKDIGNTLIVGKEVERDSTAPSHASGCAAAGVQGKSNDGARRKDTRKDDTVRKDGHASNGSTTVASEEKPTTRSSTEEGEITGTKLSLPLQKIPVQESTPQSASRKKTPPARVSTVTSIVPTEPRAERRLSRTVEATPDPKYRGPRGDTTAVHSSASRSDSKRGHGHDTLPARPAVDNPEHEDPMTWEAYKAPPARHAYAKPSREQRPRSASPVLRDSDFEVERFAYQHPDLRDWLYYTGWDAPAFRRNELARLRRLEEIERERAALKQECEREKAELKGDGEPAGKARRLSDGGSHPLLRRAEDVEPAEYRMLGRYTVTAGNKRERGEGSDGDRDGGFSAKFYRTNRNYRGSRAGYHGTYHRGREESRHWQDREVRRRSSRTSPSHGFREGSPPRAVLQPRYPRHRYSSPVGHPLPRNELDTEHASDRYASRDRLPHRRPERSSSPPPHGRGHKTYRFHKSEYGRL
ncbi:hypothetical protein Daus18300_004689 [Diaporthe australafricana]|uniref:Uncharacterized protein n=1 Tax=Diaporthe australafricana TaxID=127596 RepID=A0ABR3X6X9_9PEZI